MDVVTGRQLGRQLLYKKNNFTLQLLGWEIPKNPFADNLPTEPMVLDEKSFSRGFFGAGPVAGSVTNVRAIRMREVKRPRRFVAFRCRVPIFGWFSVLPLTESIELFEGESPLFPPGTITIAVRPT